MTSSVAQKTLPTSAKARYLAPDVARGLALLGIILANTTSFWLADWSVEHAAYFGGYSGTPTALEQIAIIFQGMFVHVRGLPMFATLLGVGIAMIVQGQLSHGSTTNVIRQLLLRRYGWLIVFGVVHSAVLFPGDILTTYGVLALIMVPLITRSDRLLKGVAAVLVAIHAAILSVAVFLELGAEPTDPVKVSAGLDNPVSDSFSEFGARLVDALFTVIFSPLSAPKLLPLVIVGFLWGRAGVFGDIETHRRILSRWAFGAAAVIVVAGLPWGLAGAGIFPEDWVPYFSYANELLSIVVGPGILAGISLAVQPVQHAVSAGGAAATPRWLVPVCALGKRSMSGYLLQSIIMAAVIETVPESDLLALNIPEKMLLALVVWLVTLVFAVALERAGRPGPFEWIHRCLSYRETNPSCSGFLDQAAR